MSLRILHIPGFGDFPYEDGGGTEYMSVNHQELVTLRVESYADLAMVRFVDGLGNALWRQYMSGDDMIFQYDTVGDGTGWTTVFTISKDGNLTIVGSVVSNTTRITDSASPYTVLATDHIIYCDTDGGAITVNLPAGVEGVNYKIINCGTSGNAVTVDGDGAEIIRGSATLSLTDGNLADLHFNSTEGWW